MAEIEKRKNGKWQARVRYLRNGERKSMSKGGFNTRKEAVIFASQLELEKTKSPEDIQKQQTFYDYFEDWYITYRKPKISESSQRAYVHTLNLIEKYFPSKQIAKITRKQYQLFITDYGKNHAPKTVKRANNLIKSCISNAVYDEILKKNFTKNITFVANREKSVSVKNLSIKEMKTLLGETIDHLNPQKTSYYMILTAILTGARLTEIGGLQWKNINFSFKTISIEKTYDYNHPDKFKPTKTTSSVRIIQIDDILLGELKRLKRLNKGRLNDLVFARPASGLVPSSAAVNITLKRMLNELNIESNRNIHFHSLRHTHVAYLLSQGVDIYAISKRLGHSNISITMEVYAYLIDESKKENNLKILNSLNNILDSEQNTDSLLG